MELTDYIRLSAETDIPLDGYRGPVKLRASSTDMLVLLHAEMGLSSELDEIGACLLPLMSGTRSRLEGRELVNYCEEIGDLRWYWAMLKRFADTYGPSSALEYPEHFAVPCCFDRGAGEVIHHSQWVATAAFLSITGACSRLTDCVKKHVYYGRNITALQVHVAAIGDAIERHEEIACAMNPTITPGLIMKANIQKLVRRFPDKFKDSDALVRNLKLEELTLAEILGIKI